MIDTKIDNKQDDTNFNSPLGVVGNLNFPLGAGGQNYDALVIGGGIAGQEAALSLADMGHEVLLVDKALSIGGKMMQLSKVFTTLDCAACITTPKMSETARHPKITLD